MRTAVKASSRLPSRLASRRPWPRYGAASCRRLSTSARFLAAQNFAMPSMSPTMSEGNIAKWHVKEGGSFATGDVILEIETDKATMDVEAQDDGILFKILQGDGSKGVKVGSRIAVLAEAGDDIASLEIPPDDMKPVAAPKAEAPKEQPKAEPVAASPAKQEAPPAPRPSAPSPAKEEFSAKPTKQTYPLYPSVASIFHDNNIPLSDADNIPASGPKGRLLKGDVLAYIGAIPKSYPSEQTARIIKLGHLDLSNIQVATTSPSATKEAEKQAEGKAAVEEVQPAVEMPIEVTMPISLASVMRLQSRLRKTLGSTPPLSTILERVAKIANDGLPRGKTELATQDELFDEILGGPAPKTSRGHYVPYLVGESTPTFPTKTARVKKSDIFDILTSSAVSHKRTRMSFPSPTRAAFEELGEEGFEGGAINMFSVLAKPGEERRARVFLKRVKTVLETDPAMLVL